MFIDQSLWQKYQDFCYFYLWPITHNFSIFMPQSATHMGQQVKDFQLEDWAAYKHAIRKSHRDASSKPQNLNTSEMRPGIEGHASRP